jgi:hypothetical protein
MSPELGVSVGAMRWDQLFADLEGQARAKEELELNAEMTDRVRGELGQISLLNRLRAQVSQPVTLVVDGAGRIGGDLIQVGADWLLLQTPGEVVIPLTAVVGVSDLPAAAVSPDGVSVVSSRLRLTAALRAVAIDRAAVTVTLRSGDTVIGTPDRVGADFVDLAVHERGETPRRSSVRTRLTLAFSALAAVRRDSERWS